MKSRKKTKPARKRAGRKTARRALRATRAAKAHRPARTRKSQASRTSRTREAIQAIQDAAASLADRDVIEILSDLSWPNRAKWLSSYFADQLPDEILADGDGVADAIDDIGGQVAELLAAMEAEQPADFLNAVTCCFSADPSHVAAGMRWLQDHLGTQTIDLDALNDLPGYRAVAEIVDRVRNAELG